MTVPMGWQQIIIPVVTAAETTAIVVSYRGQEEAVIWDCGQGFLLSPGTALSTSKVIFYFSVALHLLPLCP